MNEVDRPQSAQIGDLSSNEPSESARAARSYGEIVFEQKGTIALLTLNRPDIRNTFTHQEMIDEIVDVCQRVQDSESVSVLVVTGAGSAFSAGGNVKDMLKKEGMFAGDPNDVRQNYRKGIQRVTLAFQRLDVPAIAAVNGPAIGAGCDLSCMCDIRIASENARFGETFVSVGLIPGDGGAFLLPRIVGFSKALEMAFTCRIIDAAEALRIGLVSEVTPADKLLDRAMEVAAEIAQHPPRILRLAKRLFYLSQGRSLEETLELSCSFQALCHHSPEHIAAIEALLARKRGDRKTGE
jgi:enoyl-CoA hydratase/carnithine racemase